MAETNEQLCERAKVGDHEALNQLYLQNKGLLYIILSRLMHNPGSASRMQRAGVTADDVMQCGYFAIMDAVQGYVPEDGHKFTAYLKYPCMNAFFDLIGMRTQKQKCEPLSRCKSLDKPSGENEEDGTLGDTISDPAAEQAIINVEEREYIQHLQRDVAQLMDDLEPQQEQTIRCRYWERLNLEQTGKRLGVSREAVRQLEAKALRRLRSHKARHIWEKYHDAVMITASYHGTGWSAWKEDGSVQERIIERLDRLEREHISRQVQRIRRGEKSIASDNMTWQQAADELSEYEMQERVREYTAEHPIV